MVQFETAVYPLIMVGTTNHQDCMEPLVLVDASDTN